MFSPVISLIIEAIDQPGRILMGVRDPITNLRHPNVLSTITARMPSGYLDLLDLDVPTSGAHGSILSDSIGHESLDGPTFAIGGRDDVETPWTKIVEHVLLKKLALSEHLKTGALRAAAQACAITADNVDDPHGTGLNELTAMVTVRLRLDGPSTLIPNKTQAYSELLWVPTEHLWQAVKSHDPMMLAPSLNVFEVCLRGLCVRSAAVVLAEADV